MLSSQQVSKEGGAGSSAIGWPIHFDGAARVRNLNADIRRYVRRCLYRQRDECGLKRHTFLRLYPNPFVDEVCVEAMGEGDAGD
jgi:hypothetical protein